MDLVVILNYLGHSKKFCLIDYLLKKIIVLLNLALQRMCC